MRFSPGLSAFKLAFELSPIVLTGGVADLIPGSALPIIALTEAVHFTEGLLSGAENLELDDFFAHFYPLPGSTLIDQVVGKYPFANQTVAANATIRNPLTISLNMVCPARDEGGYATKLATMSLLQSVLAQHNASGGTYVVATPSFFYTNCLLLRITDASGGQDKQAQNTYRWDFERPLLTLQDAQQSYNNLMGKIAGGLPTDGAWSGLGPAVATPSSLGVVGLVPAATPVAGSGVAAPNPVGGFPS